MAGMCLGLLVLSLACLDVDIPVSQRDLVHSLALFPELFTRISP
jgi:hypothetical protein